MRPFARVTLLATLLLPACAPNVKVARSPGSSPTTTLYRLDDLAFEGYSSYRAQEKGDGILLTFCPEREAMTCGTLGVTATSDLTPAQCADGSYVRGVLRLRDDVPLHPYQLAGLSGWRAADHVLLLCDGKRAWYVKAFGFSVQAMAPATAAYELFVRTARLERATTSAAAP